MCIFGIALPSRIDFTDELVSENQRNVRHAEKAVMDVDISSADTA